MAKKENQKAITADELKQIQELTSKANAIVFDLGVLQVRTRVLNEAHTEVSKEVEECKATLSKEYGEVNIDLKDGKISPVEKKEDEAEVVETEEVK